MNISFISSFDIKDITSYSGTAHFMSKKLEESGSKVSYIEDLRNLNPIHEKFKRGFHSLFGKNYLIERNPNVLKIWASEIEKKLSPETMVLTSYSSLPFAKLDTSKPKVFWADAVFANMVDYYKVYSNLCSESLKHGNQMEYEALQNVTCAVYSSAWAANAAVKFYGVSPEKIKVVPYGANIDVNYTLQEVQDRARNLSFESCNLLFLGREWHRKGGDIAVTIVEELNNRGIRAKLSVIGADPGKEIRKLDFVNVFGFIKKSEKKGRDLLNQLISGAHFLLLPSRADCTPIVISEMNAHGIPVITTNEGGIPSLIREGVNGYMLDKSSPPGLFADCIESLFAKRERYIELSKSSFNEYQTRLNWDHSIQQFKKILEEIV